MTKHGDAVEAREGNGELTRQPAAAVDQAGLELLYPASEAQKCAQKGKDRQGSLFSAGNHKLGKLQIEQHGLRLKCFEQRIHGRLVTADDDTKAGGRECL